MRSAIAAQNYFRHGPGFNACNRIQCFRLFGGYQYDFGDDWRHVVNIEKTLPAEPGASYPRCIDGKRRCPPEDCGGAYGYENLLETVRNPSRPEHEQMLDWVGGSFDPETFDIESANRRLR